VTTDDEGRIVVAGYSSNPQQHMTVARLDASGVLDPEFGDGGVVKLDIGVRARSHAVAVQPDGAIVVAGFAVLIPSGIEQFITARLLDDGSPDPDFGNEGWVATAFGQRDARALALALQPDGAIVVAGWARNWSNRDVAVVRYTPTGALDGGFGNGGKATYGVGIGNDEATAVALDGDGRVVIAGYAADGSTYNLMAGRLTSGGQPDPGFNSTGFVRVSASTGVEQANAVLLQADGKVVIAGRSKLNGNQVFALARVTGAGALDATFGTGGITTTAIGELAEVQGIAAVTRGRFVVAGRARLPGGRLQFVTARYQSNGSIDATFGNSGFVLIPLGVKNDEAYAVEAGEDGSILLAGTMRVGNNANFGLARLLVDACGDGFLDAGEECDEGAGPSCCSSTCTVVPAGAVCRAVADACDVEELCDGIASTCGLDEGLPDGDFDGVCDEQDICPLAADPLQKDGDGDGLGDACDPCTSGVVLERPTVRFGGLSTPGGDDTVKIIGTVTLPPGTLLAPRDRGARVLVHAADGSLLFDATIPPGTFDSRTGVGWKVSGNGKVHKFRSPVPVDGLVRKFRMIRALTSGRYHLKIVGSPLDLSQQPLFGALQVTVAVDPTVLGRCSEIGFGGPAHACSLNEDQSTLVCR